MTTKTEVKTGMDDLPKYVSSFRDRQGKMRYRFRRDGFSAYLNSEPGTLEFQEQYEALRAGLGPCRFRRYGGVQVYFVSDGEAVKIGYASNLTKRIEQIQTGSSRPINLLAAIPGSRGLERAYHRMFGEHRMRARGEWFSLHDEILAEIDRINSGRDPTPLGLPPPKHRSRGQGLSQSNGINGSFV